MTVSWKGAMVKEHKEPVPYTNVTQQSGRVVIRQYIEPVVTTIFGCMCTTDPLVVHFEMFKINNRIVGSLEGQLAYVTPLMARLDCRRATDQSEKRI